MKCVCAQDAEHHGGDVIPTTAKESCIMQSYLMASIRSRTRGRNNVEVRYAHGRT
jgi:hypothetical protein